MTTLKKFSTRVRVQTSLEVRRTRTGVTEARIMNRMWISNRSFLSRISWKSKLEKKMRKSCLDPELNFTGLWQIFWLPYPPPPQIPATPPCNARRTCRPRYHTPSAPPDGDQCPCISPHSLFQPCCCTSTSLHSVRCHFNTFVVSSPEMFNIYRLLYDIL